MSHSWLYLKLLTGEPEGWGASFFPVSKSISTVDYCRSWSLIYTFSMYTNSTFPKLTSFGDCLNLSFLNYLLEILCPGVQPLVSSGLLWIRTTLTSPAATPFLIHRWWHLHGLCKEKHLLLDTLEKSPGASWKSSASINNICSTDTFLLWFPPKKCMGRQTTCRLGV